ncbi:MAG: hypothetical protein S0880_36895 [Actinomycetota bacterium]|nr:hypothetical protein [Actinomycetota bacterium]
MDHGPDVEWDRPTTGFLGRISTATWLRALGIAVVAAVVIGVPTDVIPNPVFGRSSIPVRWWDPIVLAVTSALIGLVLALRPGDVAVDGDLTTADPDLAPADGADRADGDDRRALLGGVGGLLAVGCPTCNHLVVALIGTSGALSFFQPIQPLLAVASVGLLLWVLRRRVRDLREPSCALPSV